MSFSHPRLYKNWILGSHLVNTQWYWFFICTKKYWKMLWFFLLLCVCLMCFNNKQQTKNITTANTKIVTTLNGNWSDLFLKISRSKANGKKLHYWIWTWKLSSVGHTIYTAYNPLQLWFPLLYIIGSNYMILIWWKCMFPVTFWIW